jgi:hypothetical protein
VSSTTVRKTDPWRTGQSRSLREGATLPQRKRRLIAAAELPQLIDRRGESDRLRPRHAGVFPATGAQKFQILRVNCRVIHGLRVTPPVLRGEIGFDALKPVAAHSVMLAHEQQMCCWHPAMITHAHRHRCAVLQRRQHRDVLGAHRIGMRGAAEKPDGRKPMQQKVQRMRRMVQERIIRPAPLSRRDGAHEVDLADLPQGTALQQVTNPSIRLHETTRVRALQVAFRQAGRRERGGDAVLSSLCCPVPGLPKCGMGFFERII